jgi:N-acetylneuraminic acid mutarotase
MRRFIVTFMALLWCSTGQAVWIVGNGGDSLRDVFYRAREHASQITSKIQERALPVALSPEMRRWILNNKSALAADILQSPHEWTMETMPTCALTEPPAADEKIPQAKTIHLSFATCRSGIHNFQEASRLLIHESIHHFGGNEDLADLVANVITAAWRSGQLTWLAVNEKEAPAAREHHSAIWTGSEMIVWGGRNDTTTFTDGGRYNPATDRWSPMSNVGAPRVHSHTALWTGSKMVVWGGYLEENESSSWQYKGAVYDPATDKWESIAAPAEWREADGNSFNLNPRQTAVFTGSKLLVWGGSSNSGEPYGGQYDLEKKVWQPITTENAPQRLAGHSALWTGHHMIIWGGYEGTHNSNRRLTRGGALYDPEKNIWIKLPDDEAAPLARADHQAIWTGEQMVIFGGGGTGAGASLNATGGMLPVAPDGAVGKWQSLKSELAVDRLGHTAVWNGEEMLIHGGKSFRLTTFYGEVLGFNPANRSFRGTSSEFAPTPRWHHTAVWTGSSLILWGGAATRGSYLSSGAIYYP